MQITEIKVFPVQEEKLKAYVTMTLDRCFVVRDMKIIQGTSGYFVSMPSKKKKDGTYKDVAHPIDKETRTMIEGMVLEEYQKSSVRSRHQIDLFFTAVRFSGDLFASGASTVSPIFRILDSFHGT
jgi:stage V sporulation protein G